MAKTKMRGFGIAVPVFYVDAFFFACLPKEIEKLTGELSESKQHLEREQQKAAGAREELLQLTERLGEAEHQLHLTRYSLIPLRTGAPGSFLGLLPQASKQLLDFALVIQFTHSLQAY